MHYSPRFKAELLPGTFRLEDDIGPFAEILRARPAAAPVAVPATIRRDAAADGLQALVDRFQNESGGRRVVGSLPVTVTFPEFGRSVFLASELLAEHAAPLVELAFKRTK